MSKPIPASFPKSLPLPRGTVVTSARRYAATGIPPVLHLQGYAPLGFADTAAYFAGELPRRGFRLTIADSEPPVEAEAGFFGNGATGAWKVRALPGCSGTVAILVGVVLPG